MHALNLTFIKKRILILFLILVAAGGVFVFAEGQDQQPAAQESAPKLVTSIQVVGNRSISTNTIISKMKTRLGSPFQEAVLSDDLKRLYLLGYFSDIKIDTEDYKNGVKIIIKVTERPLIEKITFSGILRITTKDEKLKEMLKSKEGQYLDYPNLAEDTKTLKKLYEKIGYNQAEVDYKVDLKENNKAVIQFTISEKRRVSIKHIFIEGNKAYSDTRILRLLKTKSGWLFNAGVLKDEVIKEDMERLKSFYRRQGYTDVAVTYEVKADEKKPSLLNIYIRIEEGKKYLVGSINITGNRDIAEKTIIAKLQDCIPGKVFSEEALKIDVANIQGLYFDKGYIAVQIQETSALNPETGRIDIAYNITENQINYVNKVKVRGNIKTKDIVVRREMRIHPGDKFDGEKLRRSKERLQNLGFFDEVSYDTEPTDIQDRKDLIVDVKEAKTGSFSFGGGYSTVEQFVGFAEIEQKNFDWKNFPYFTGAGQDLKFRGSFGSLSNGYELSFTEPWMLDYPIAFGFDAYQRIHKKSDEAGYAYDEKVTGGDLRLGKEFSEYIRGDINYRYDMIKIGNVADNAGPDLTSELGTNKISSTTAGASFDSRDNIFDTTKGDLVGGSFQLAGGMFGGDKNFWKSYVRASHYIPMFRGSSTEVRFRMGIADYYGNSDKLPIYERFFVGGADSVRGYHERKLGPIDPSSNEPLGGNSMMIGNIEYTYPLFNFLKLATFFDIGNSWEKAENIGSGHFKSSAGFGVRIKTPIGPMKLDYGIPFNIEPGEDKRGSGRFHFSASQGF